MPNLVILMIVAGLIGFLIGREAKDRAAKKKAGTPQPSVLSRLQKANPFVRGRGDKEQFETWLENSANASKPLQDWYKDADEKGQKAFVNALAHFAGSFGIKLSGLNDEELQKNASELHASYESLVNEYGQTYLKGAGVKTRVAALTQLEKWEAHPAAYANREITEGVYAELKENKAIAHHLPKKGSARDKRDAMVKAIQKYRTEQPQAFYEVFTAVVAGNGHAEEETTEREPAKPQRSKRNAASELATT